MSFLIQAIDDITIASCAYQILPHTCQHEPDRTAFPLPFLLLHASSASTGVAGPHAKRVDGFSRPPAAMRLRFGRGRSPAGFSMKTCFPASSAWGGDGSDVLRAGYRVDDVAVPSFSSNLAVVGESARYTVSIGRVKPGASGSSSATGLYRPPGPWALKKPQDSGALLARYPAAQ